MKHLHESSKRKEINLSIKFRIIPIIGILFIVGIIDFLSSLYAINYTIYLLLVFYSITLFYLYKIKIKSHMTFWGYILPTFDVVIASVFMIDNITNDHVMMSAYIIYAVSIALTSLQAHWRYTIYSGILCILSFIYIVAYFNINNIKNGINLNNGVYDFILINFYYVVLTSVLSIKNFVRDRSFDEARNIAFEKYVTGAHLALLPTNGVHEFRNWEIRTMINHSEIIGADFIGIKEEENDKSIIVAIGDVISHGMDISPIAYACLSVFHGSYSVSPTNILKDINRVTKKIGKKNGGETLVLVLRLQDNGEIVYNGMIGTDMIFIPGEDSAETSKALDTNGFILGKNDADPSFFKDKHIKLLNKDKIILYTDGLDDHQLSDDFSQVIITYKGNGEIKES